MIFSSQENGYPPQTKRRKPLDNMRKIPVYRYAVHGQHLSVNKFTSFKECAAYIKYCLENRHAVTEVVKL